MVPSSKLPPPRELSWQQDSMDPSLGQGRRRTLWSIVGRLPGLLLELVFLVKPWDSVWIVKLFLRLRVVVALSQHTFCPGQTGIHRV